MIKKYSMSNTRIKNYNYFLYSFYFVFFTALLFYFRFLINPVLYFQAQEPVFFFDTTFFHDFLGYPGGLVQYFSALLSQLYYFPWAGALLITLLIAGIVALTGRMIQKMTGIIPRFIQMVPAIVLLVLHNHYHHPLSNTVALLVTLVFVNIYLLFHDRWRILFFFVSGILFYFIAGGQFLLFSLMVVLYEILVKKQYIPGLIFLIFTAVLPFISSSYIFIFSLRDSYLSLLPFNKPYHPLWVPYLLVGFYPLTIITLAIIKQFEKRESKNPLKKWVLKIKQLLKLKYVIPVQGILILLVTVLVAYGSYSKDSRNLLLINYLARMEKWHSLLAVAQHVPPNDAIITYQINRALYHTGKLASEMFSYPQIWGRYGLFLSKDYIPSSPLYWSDVYYDIGLYNEALHWGHEALIVRGETGWNLQRLAMVNLINGEIPAAKKYIYKLKKSPLFRKWALHYSRFVDNEAELSQDKYFQSLRSKRVDSDFLAFVEFPENELIALLQANSQNKAAFEYLMAYYLLTRRLDDFIAILEKIPATAHIIIPRHYEEAVLYYASFNKDKGKSLLEKIRISKTTYENYREFNRIMILNKNSPDNARWQLLKDFGNTYWYYLIFYKT